MQALQWKRPRKEKLAMSLGHIRIIANAKVASSYQMQAMENKIST
jgi:hypothetical protein